MTKRTKIIIICACVAIIAVALYFYFRTPKVVTDPVTGEPKTPGSGTGTTIPKNSSSVSGTGAGNSTGSTGSGGITAPAVTAGNDEFPLKVGSSGDRVKLLQNALNRIKPTLSLPSDGTFNEATRTAVIAWVGTAYYPVSAVNYSNIMIKSMNQN
jgi:hypothetical protein